jgi:predicted ester cyclase
LVLAQPAGTLETLLTAFDEIAGSPRRDQCPSRGRSCILVLPSGGARHEGGAIVGTARDLLEANVRTWNDHDEASWVDQFSSDATFRGPGGMSGSGTEMARTFYHIWQDGFPDNQVRIVRIVDGGDAAVLEAVFEGTQTNALNAPGGSIPATGKRVAIPFVTVQGFANDRFTTFALYFDQMELVTQLGLSQATPAG